MKEITTKMSMKITLDEEHIKQAVKEYIESKGYNIIEDVYLNFEHKVETVGYGMSEMDVKHTILSAIANVKM